jgi:inhibitor of KinA
MKKSEPDRKISKAVWFPAGDRGLLLDLIGYSAQLGSLPPSAERQKLTCQARAVGQSIRVLCTDGKLVGITDIVPGLASVLVHYDPCQIQAEQIKKTIGLILDSIDTSTTGPVRSWTLPVLYGAEAGPDLEEVASRSGHSPQEVIELHCQTSLEVGIMGFLPGLAYMTGLHPDLHLPRRTEPRTHVKGGSVAIAMDQTVIYPLDSPGGWNLIGLMPIPLFDPRRDEPVLLAPGDQIRFRSICAEEYTELEKVSADGTLALTAEIRSA